MLTYAIIYFSKPQYVQLGKGINEDGYIKETVLTNFSRNSLKQLAEATNGPINSRPSSAKDIKEFQLQTMLSPTIPETSQTSTDTATPLINNGN